MDRNRDKTRFGSDYNAEPNLDRVTDWVQEANYNAESAVKQRIIQRFYKNASL